jgi:hypothetical protein
MNNSAYNQFCKDLTIERGNLVHDIDDYRMYLLGSDILTLKVDDFNSHIISHIKRPNHYKARLRYYIHKHLKTI